MAGGVSRAALITGCSSGIGFATARHLARAGYKVYATARRVGPLAPLRAEGCVPLALDVTDEASMRKAVAAVETAEGAVGVLVNNAGYAQTGAVESVSPDQLRRQFETNVFGAMRLTQLALPGMRRQGWGRVVMLSSMGGKMTFPGYGVYHGSKYAIEALSDALRYEVAPFGVRVIVIEPGFVKSGFGHAAVASLGPNEDGGPYGAFNGAVSRATSDAYVRGPFAMLAGEPDDVARTIERAVSSRRPRARYPVTASARLFFSSERYSPIGRGMPSSAPSSPSRPEMLLASQPRPS